MADEGARGQGGADPASITLAIRGEGSGHGSNPFAEEAPNPTTLGRAAETPQEGGAARLAGVPWGARQPSDHNLERPPGSLAQETSFQRQESDPGYDDAEKSRANWVANYKKEERKFTDFFPPCDWVPRYIRVVSGRGTKEDEANYGALPYSAKGDLIAGVTVGFMLVPQSLAFALLAGLPVQIGLYASFAPLLVYAFMGTIRQVQPGPTALMSLIAGSALDSMDLELEGERVAGAALLSVVVGIISVALGAVQFGFIVDFMSHSVMCAFCSAAGITIATSQMKYMFGVQIERQHYWWETVIAICKELGTTDGATFALAWSLLGILLLLKYWKSAGSENAREAHLLWRYFPKDKNSAGFKALKTVADMSSLLSVVLGWFWGALYRAGGVDSVQLVGKIDSEGFRFIVPGAGVENFNFDAYFISAAIAAVVGFLETMAVGGKFAMQGRYNYDANQELLALGFMNVIGGLMSGYPTTGSFSRTAVNAQCGATSLLATTTSSLLVLFSALFLLPIVEKLPLCSLAPIIIQGAIGVVDVHEFIVAYRASFNEFIVMLTTFVVSLGLTVKEGLATGFILSILKTMYDLSNPNFVVCGRLPNGQFRDLRIFPDAEQLPNAVVVRMDARLNFANSRKMKEFALQALQVRMKLPECKISYLIIDGRPINDVDLTGCAMLEVLSEVTHSRGVKLVVCNLKAPVAKELVAAGVHTVLKQNEGFLGDFTLDKAVEITQGRNDLRASKDLRALIMAHDDAMETLADAKSGKSLVATLHKCMGGDRSEKASRHAGTRERSESEQIVNHSGYAGRADGTPSQSHGPSEPSITQEEHNPFSAVDETTGPPMDTTADEERPEEPSAPAGARPQQSLPPPPPPVANTPTCGTLAATIFVPCGISRRVV